jgi:hypothetical protein
MSTTTPEFTERDKSLSKLTRYTLFEVVGMDVALGLTLLALPVLVWALTERSPRSLLFAFGFISVALPVFAFAWRYRIASAKLRKELAAMPGE